MLRWAAVVALAASAGAQTIPDMVATPPEALRFAGGKSVATAAEWGKRRAEILREFTESVYGRTPKEKIAVRYRVVESDAHALNGTAVRKQITATFGNRDDGPQMHILLYLPAGAKGRSPVFVGLNFTGNHTVAADDGIALNSIWQRPAGAPRGEGVLVKQMAQASQRGSGAGRWQVDKIIAQGFGLATVYYGDIEPDFDGGMKYGVRALFLKNGEAAPGPREWGAIGAWAWGLSRTVDYLETDSGVDPKRIALIGHSRLGKTALWAAAQDERFALVVSNESGKGGASLYRRKEGETIEHLNTAFPHWFSGEFHQYTGHPERVPVDANLLLALIAPRPLYVASAEEDHTSDPPGEFYGEMLASPVYELLGRPGLGTEEYPAVNHPVGSAAMAYHVRTGKHDVTAYDWEQYLRFAAKAFGTATGR